MHVFEAVAGSFAAYVRAEGILEREALASFIDSPFSGLSWYIDSCATPYRRPCFQECRRESRTDAL